MTISKTFTSICGLFAFGLMAPALGQMQGQPASNQLGGEDIWVNPTFTSGTGNNGETAHSEW